jgi:activator of HSP90 ATPase
MVRTIEQLVDLPASAATLYRTYVDPEQHAAVTGAPVSIGEEPGSPFLAFNGTLSGRILFTVPDRMLVQTWRSNQWDPEDLDSVLTLRFVDAGPASGSIELVHVGVAASDLAGVTEGWTNFYWTPWREYLAVA